MKRIILFAFMALCITVVHAQIWYMGSINDPDGYTNVRKSQSSSSPIVTRYTTDDVFIFQKGNGNWWPIYNHFRGEVIGYMHKSRINNEGPIGPSKKGEHYCDCICDGLPCAYPATKSYTYKGKKIWRCEDCGVPPKCRCVTCHER